MLLIALGSAGDTHPFVGLGRELARRGHAVTLAANPIFQPLITAAGLGFCPIGTAEAYRQVIENEDLWHPMKGFKLVAEYGFIQPLPGVYELIRERYRPGHMVVVAHPLALGARVAQEKLGVPTVSVHLAPAVFRTVHQMPNLPGARLPDGAPAFLKRGLYWLIDKVLLDRLLAKPLNAFRRQIGLPGRVKRIMQDWWLSPECVIGLFPDFYRPFQPDWPKQLHLTSFPLYDPGGTPAVAAELDAFLAEGSPPVVFTPGSANRHAQAFFEKAVAACRAVGRRAVLLSRYAENVPEDLPAGMRHFSYAPLAQMLPRCAALVSHGGIGTVAQGLAAGVPQVVMALAHDQHDNGTRLAQLGVGRWVDGRKFTERFLTTALRELLTDPAVAARCAEYKAALAARDGIGEACDLIEATPGAPGR